MPRTSFQGAPDPPSLDLTWSASPHSLARGLLESSALRGQEPRGFPAVSTPVLTSKASAPLQAPTVPRPERGFLYLPPLTIPRRPWGMSRLGVAGSGLSGPVTATFPGLPQSVSPFCRVLSTSGQADVPVLSHLVPLSPGLEAGGFRSAQHLPQPAASSSERGVEM